MFRFFVFTIVCVSIIFTACSKKEEGVKEKAFKEDRVSVSEIKEGLWEITTTMEATGNLPTTMPSQTITQCITKNNSVPHKVEPNQDCKFTKNEVKGNTVSWIVECKTEEGPVTTEGTVTYKGTNFDGKIKTKQKDMVFTMIMKGKWIGECK